eukprot:SAG31_NODE_454_length_15434_cov_39.578285_4_plen_179_part_00
MMASPSGAGAGPSQRAVITPKPLSSYSGFMTPATRVGADTAGNQEHINAMEHIRNILESTGSRVCIDIDRESSEHWNFPCEANAYAGVPGALLDTYRSQSSVLFQHFWSSSDSTANLGAQILRKTFGRCEPLRDGLVRHVGRSRVRRNNRTVQHVSLLDWTPCLLELAYTGMDGGASR